MKKKKYSLHKKVYENKQSDYIWKDTKLSSNDLMELKSLCPVGYRIVDNSNGRVVHEPK